MSSGAAKGARVHLIGAGGAGMSGLARLLLQTGHRVSGSDASDSAALRALGDLGARIAIGHQAVHVDGAERVVISPVIAADNDELKAARAAGLAIQTRAQALGALVDGRDVVAVAGSHGKTTTTAMLAFVLARAGLEPGHYLGGACPSLGGLSASWGPRSLFVLEACEAFGALESWRPTHCLVTNIDDEHLEHYGGQEQLTQAFQSLVDRTAQHGSVVLCGDDARAAALGVLRPNSTVTFGLQASNEVRGLVRSLDGDASVFGVTRRGALLGEVRLGLPGEHNVRNALGVVAMALELGVPFDTVASALGEFQGVERRLSRVGAAAGVQVLDDFAHHPTEIDAVMQVARAGMGGNGKLVVAFATQPHDGLPRLARRFAAALSAADLVLLAPLQAAGDASAARFEQLAGAIRASGTPHVRLGGPDQLASAALDHLGQGDRLLVLGPSEVRRAGPQVLQGLKAREGQGLDAPEWSISRGRTVPAAEPPCLVSLILAQARRRPEAAAVQCGEETLAYAQLIERAARIADALTQAGLEAGEIVAVSLERSPWRVAAFLAVLWAGGVYLPVDPALPAKRKRLMLGDARARVAIAPPGSVEDASIRIIDLEVLPPPGRGWNRPGPARSGSEAAYMIYTSGTTGQPKGVVVEHASIANFASAAVAAFEIDQTSRVSNASAFGFDVAVGEMAMTFAAGACLVVPPEATGLVGGPLGRLVRDQGVTHLSMTPSALATLPAHDYPAITHVIVAGEACPPDLAERWGASRVFINGYGPTEATVLATFDRHAPGQAITIGKAMDNACAFILDAEERPLRRGAAGELWLSGAGLARGYFRRKDLTAERFRTVRPDGRKPVRAYRTGDLAAMLPDGRIRYLGRADDQVKLRGFRIELGEIEACLRSHPQVKDAAVDLRRNPAGQELLVGYVVAEDVQAPPATEALLEHVAGRLPAYMTLSTVVAIDAVPLSSNGKRDRSALPDPPRLALRRGGAPKAPSEGLESELHDLFRRELAIDDPFGVRDTLVDLGVDSLKTANLFLAVEARYGVELQLETAAGADTIELLALHVGRLLGESSPQGRPEPALAASIVRKQLTYLAAWSGARRTPKSLIVTRGDGGQRPPLFWCCQGNDEHEQLSAGLGPGLTVHGMRSGHLVFRYEPSTVGALASRYVEEILELQPQGPIRLGGNCQGGTIAQEIAGRLIARGREVEVLFLLDPGRFRPSRAPISLIFGVGSEQNPYRGGAAPERVFEEAYPAGYSVDFLPGAHGLYFEAPGLDALAGVIGARLTLLDRTATPEPA